MTYFPYCLLFHVHTSYSADCLISPRFLIKYCENEKIDVLIVTDHDSIDSFNELNLLNRDKKIIIIPGVEYTTDVGDIIGIFVDEKIPFTSYKNLSKNIRLKGGLVVLPHPYKGHKLEEINLNHIDIIEVFNSRCSKRENYLAKKLAIDFNKPMIFGSDAHLASELSLVRNRYHVHEKTMFRTPDQLKELFLKGTNDPIGHYSTKKNIAFSQIIKSFRNRELKLIIKNILALLFHFLSEDS